MNKRDAAKEYIQLLRRELSADALSDCQSGEAIPSDFIDANVLLAEACGTEGDMALMSDVWKLADDMGYSA